MPSQIMAPSVAQNMHDQKVIRPGLEGDGVCDRLFELLWRRDLLSDSSLELRIPDTVIFRYSAPSVWYFTSVDGTIKKKSKAKMNCDHIVAEFCKRSSPSEIVACYISCAKGDSSALGAVLHLGGDANDSGLAAGTRTTIEYMNREELHDFLCNRQTVRPDGILQRFIEPKGDQNNMIRVLWSPKVCLLERRVNKKKLSETKYDVYERAVTFEGPDFLSQVTPVRGPALVLQVHDVADSIVQHIAAVSGDGLRISRMALNFKLDNRDRLWLMFASSVRMRDELRKATQLGQVDSLLQQGLTNTPLDADVMLKVPDHVRRVGTTMASRPMSLQCTCRCPTCAEKVEAGSLCDVTYKVIIEYEEQKHGPIKQPLPVSLWPPGHSKVEDPQRQPEPEVPKTITQIHPRLTAAEYARFRHDVAFLYKVATVCEACYLRFSAPQLGSYWRGALPFPDDVTPDDSEAAAPQAFPQKSSDGLQSLHDEETQLEADTNSEPPPLLGTQALDPGRLRKRQRATEKQVAELKAEETEELGKAFDFMRQREQKATSTIRSKSCPKLPSWGGHLGSVNVPAPVLESRPPPPLGPVPRWSDVRPARSLSAPLELSPQRRRKVPPLLGEPYLRDLQAFAWNCPKRAEYVIPSVPPPAASRRKLGSQARGKTTPASELGPTGTPAVSSDAKVKEVPAAFDKNTHIYTPRSLQVSSSSTPCRGVASASRRVDCAKPANLDDSCDDIAEDSDGVCENLQLWEDWPTTCKTTGGRSTPTTRPPSGSQGGSRLSSGPNSRSNSRPMSRLGSAQSTRQLQEASRSGRPQSSQVPKRRGSLDGEQERATMHRPASSPTIRPPRPRSAVRWDTAVVEAPAA